jgi:hypothetical protein
VRWATQLVLLIRPPGRSLRETQPSSRMREALGPGNVLRVGRDAAGQVAERPKILLAPNSGQLARSAATLGVRPANPELCA